MSYPVKKRRSGGSGIGLLLVALGVFFIVAPLLGGAFWSLFWPFFVLAPGMFLFYLVKHLGKSASVLTVPATMITALGLLLFAQNITGLWGTWAYAWSLIFPGSLGLGLAVYGELARKPTAERWGEGMAQVGLGIFMIGAFFHVLFAVGGLAASILGGLAMPLILIGLGIYLMRRSRKPKRTYSLGGSYRGELGDGSSRIETPIFDKERDRERV